MRLLSLAALLGGAFALAAGLTSTQAQPPGGEWVTVKGQVILSHPPQKKEVAVTTDKAHCESKGVLSYEDVIVNPKSHGLKNVVVWLRPDSTDRKAQFPKDKVNPQLAKEAPKNHLIDQPTCQFVPRVVAARVGDTIEFKNGAPVNHNINYASDAEPFNINLPPGMAKKTKPLEYQSSPITFKCDIHPWMQGRVRVFDNPYFAVTDDDGKFELRGVPAGKWRIVYWHEDGYHKGRAGALGFPEDIKAGANNTMELKPIDYEFPK